jgi:hypothetical protein
MQHCKCILKEQKFPKQLCVQAISASLVANTVGVCFFCIGADADFSVDAQLFRRGDANASVQECEPVAADLGVSLGLRLFIR